MNNVLNTYDEMLKRKALKERTIVFNEEVDTESIYQVTYWMDKIKEYDDIMGTPKKDRIITIEISSGGGSCISGFFLCSKMLKFEEEYGYKIITRINEYACSMAFLIFICGTEREMYRFSEAMFHQPLSGSWGWEKLQDIEDKKDELMVAWEKAKVLCRERTHMTDEMMETCKREKRDWWILSEEALKLGVATKII